MTDPVMIAGLLRHSPEAVRRHYARGTARWSDEAVRGLASDQLRGSLDSLALHVEAVRLAAYRTYVGQTVRSVSPILLDVCAREGLLLDDLVLDLRPAATWPGWLCGRRPRTAYQALKGTRWWAHALRIDDEYGFAMFVHSGLVVRPKQDTAGGLGIRVFGSGLELGMTMKAATLRTSEGTAWLKLADQLPETLHRGLPGLLLDTVIDDPLFAGRGYRIVSVARSHGDTSVIAFHAEPVPWTFPWARA